jgi:hypothetical protein
MTTLTTYDKLTRKRSSRNRIGELANSPIYDLIIAHERQLGWHIGDSIVVGALATTAVHEVLGDIWRALLEEEPKSYTCRVVKEQKFEFEAIWLEVNLLMNKDIQISIKITDIRLDLCEAFAMAMGGRTEALVHLKPALRLVKQNGGGNPQ